MNPAAPGSKCQRFLLTCTYSKFKDHLGLIIQFFLHRDCFSFYQNVARQVVMPKRCFQCEPWSSCLTVKSISAAVTPWWFFRICVNSSDDANFNHGTAATAHEEASEMPFILWRYTIKLGNEHSSGSQWCGTYYKAACIAQHASIQVWLQRVK